MSNDLSVRRATGEDMRFCYDLSMLPNVREMSVRSDVFGWKEHQDWMIAKLADSKTFFFIGEVDGEPVGQIRWGLTNDGAAEVAISVSPERRWTGYAREMLGQTEPLIECERYVALIVPQNVPSIALFEAAGYRFVGEETRLNKQVRRYEKEVAPSASEQEKSVQAVPSSS